jgi:hypothetical protein
MNEGFSHWGMLFREYGAMKNMGSKKEDQVDQRHFVLSEEQWQAFTEALDRPARHLPDLEKLLQAPSILDRT